jgi:hypothetical protein
VKKARLLLAVTFLAANVDLSHAALSNAAARAVDETERTLESVSSTQKIGFQMTVNNDSVSSGRIAFSFEVTGPAPSAVRRYSHTGNSAPANVTGQVITKVAGVPVSQFYSTPGAYRLTATAVLDGQTVTQTDDFLVQGPEISLIRPAINDANVLSDPHIQFQWSGSGAVKYRVTISDNERFLEQKTFIQSDTTGAETFLNYRRPFQPSTLETLSPDTWYYWKVEGLDGSSPPNVIVKSEIRKFKLKADAVSVSAGVDLAIGFLQKAQVTESVFKENAEKGQVLVEVVVGNGGKLAQNVKDAVTLTVGGQPVPVAEAADIPAALYVQSANNIATIPGPGWRTLYFKAPLAVATKDAPLFAVLTHSNDVTPNNNKAYGKLDVSKTPSASAASEDDCTMTLAEIWEVLGPDVLAKLTGNPWHGKLSDHDKNKTLEITGVEGMAQEELCALVRAAKAKKASLSEAGLSR